MTATLSISDAKEFVINGTGLAPLLRNEGQGIDETEKILEKLIHCTLSSPNGCYLWVCLSTTGLDGTSEDLVDMFIVHTIEEIQGLIDAHNQVSPTFQGNIGRKPIRIQCNRLLGQGSGEHRLRNTKFPEAWRIPTLLSLPVSLRRNGPMCDNSFPQRDGTLQNEFRKQQNNEMLRRQFAEKANQVGPWIERQMDAVTAIGMGLQGSLEDQMQRLKEYQQGVQAYRPHIEELEKIHQAVQESMIFENRYTQYTMETLRVGWEQLLTSINRNINEVENQILTRDSKGITQEQLNEFRSSFNHFDKNRTGRLAKDEFKSCLVSLGYSIGKDRQGDIDFQRIMAAVDPNNSGAVTFDAFLDFMTRESTDVDTAEQVIDSFRILAADKPYILPDELRRELPPDQAEYCIQRMSPFKGAGAVPGALDYMSFSTALYGESDM
ncbi:Alpha-actinin, sarcomeric [Orchesella cincta]|uniref:Alpha-actinin, sarcomeric n=1 Tax=Orchesella cincta TaxID=48709 RepID=A0A1D2M5F1_ORCCI|nr:Alpha-actinin, sarcomeric [Orchesella cincta]